MARYITFQLLTTFIISSCSAICSDGIIITNSADAGKLAVQVIFSEENTAKKTRLVLSRNKTGITCPSYVDIYTDTGGLAELSGINPGSYSINLPDTPIYKEFDILPRQEKHVELTMPLQRNP